MKKTCRAEPLREKAAKWLLAGCVCLSSAAVVLIFGFLLAAGWPAVRHTGLLSFLLGSEWMPGKGQFGIFPMIAGSLLVTLLALLIALPSGVMTAVFLARFCPQRLYRLIRPAVSVMAGIPSVVYGFFALAVIVPAVRELLGGRGMSLLSASLTAAMMILPTVISVSESAIKASAPEYYEGALALGATHEQSVFGVVLPAAKSGICTAAVLGAGRAAGETTAVVMVAGNQPLVPHSLTDGVRTLTAGIAMEMGYATEGHRQALIAMGAVLLVFSLGINTALRCIGRSASA